MSRIINPESASKARTQLTRAIVLALRELMQKTDTDDQTRDLAAFIVLALASIYKSIDVSVAAWEKRGYWIKADRYRMEWIWTEKLGSTMREALMDENWGIVAMTSAQVMQKLQNIKVPQRHKLGTPWDGAWEQLTSKQG